MLQHTRRVHWGVKITILQIPRARREGGWKHRKELKNDPILMDNDYEKWINRAR